MIPDMNACQPVLIVNSAEPMVREFVDPLTTLVHQSGYDYHLVEYRELVNLELDQYSAIILSGSPCGNDIVDHHLSWFDFLEWWKKPLLGICAGHHLVGSYFGSRLIRESEKEIGTVNVELVQYDPVFEGLSNNFQAEAMHHDSITLPDGFTVLARTRSCRNVVMKRNGYVWYTFQFHPEIRNRKIIENFLALSLGINKKDGQQ